MKIEPKILFLLSGRIIQALVAVLTIRFMTEFLASAEVGQQYIINSILLGFSLVLINPVGMFINRYLHEWKDKKSLYFHLGEANKYFLLIALASIPVVLALKEFFHIVMSLETFSLIAFVACYVYFSTWFQTLTSFFNLFDLQKKFVSLNIINQMTGLTLAVAFTNFISASALLWLSGILAGQMVTLLIALYWFYGEFKPQNYNFKPEHNLLFSKATFMFCAPIGLATVCMWFGSQGYRLIIEKSIGVEKIALIGLGLGMATSLAGVVESIVTQYLYPTYYRHISNVDLAVRQKSWVELFQRTSAVYIPCCFLIIASSHLIVRVLTAPGFYESYIFLIIGAVIEFFRQSSNIAYLVSHSENKTYYSITPYLAGVLVLIGMLAVLSYLDQMTNPNIAFALLLSGVVTYFFNIRQATKLIAVKVNFINWLKSMLVSLPLCGIIFITKADSSFVYLVVLAAAATIWCTVCIYLGLTKFNKPAR